MAGFRWGWLKPLAAAAVLTLVAGTPISVVAQTSASAHTDSALESGGSSTNEASQASATGFALLPGNAATTTGTATITGTEIESLPSSGRRWEEFVLGAPRDAAQSNGAPPSLTLSGPESADIIGSGGDDRVYGMGNNGIAYDMGRNTFRYPNAWKADVRLGKQIDFGKMRQLELLGETFNLFNHRNVTEVETIGYSVSSGNLNGIFPSLTYFTGLKANSTAFGEHLNSNSTSYYRERQVQFGMRMRF